MNDWEQANKEYLYEITQNLLALYLNNQLKFHEVCDQLIFEFRRKNVGNTKRDVKEFLRIEDIIY